MKPIIAALVLASCTVGLENPTPGNVSLTSAAACRPVRRYAYTLAQPVMMGCGQTVVLAADVPDDGRALARFSGSFTNLDGSRIFSWNAQVNFTGASTGSFASGVAEDICPGETRTKSTLGYGYLSNGYRGVRVMAGDIYACPSVYGVSAVQLAAGASLEVWVEDPACELQQIRAASLIAGGGAFVWQTSMKNVLTLPPMTKPAGATGNLLIMATSEASTTEYPPNPNSQCGMQAAPLIAQTLVAGAYSSTVIEQIPASQGQGHLVLNNATTRSLADLPDSFAAALDLGSNTSATTIFTGAYGGYNIGDAILAAVLATDVTTQGASCSFNSVLLADGESAMGYRSPSVPPGQVCDGQLRTCQNGVLIGDAAYQYNSCDVQ